MTQRILFVVRGKLGDSLVAHAVALAYARSHPRDEISLLIRRDYARLLGGEPGLRILPFGSRFEMIARLLWLRLTRPPLDVLAVLWGFGKAIEQIAQLVRARRRLYLDSRLARLYPEFPPPARDHSLLDPAVRVVRLLDPGFEAPDRLQLPSLAARRRPERVIGVVPLANEPRRNLDPETLAQLIEALRERHPGKRLWIFVNPSDRGARRLLERNYPAEVSLKLFRKPQELLEHYFALEAWYGTDTGLYHLAVASGIPCTVFFGPTQPKKIVLAGQPDATWVRLAVLDNEHCEVKTCARPLCLYQTVANFAGVRCATRIEATPLDCPLRAFAPTQLALNRTHENPDRQAR